MLIVIIPAWDAGYLYVKDHYENHHTGRFNYRNVTFF
jgi:hypothetical protein